MKRKAAKNDFLPLPACPAGRGLIAAAIFFLCLNASSFAATAQVCTSSNAAPPDPYSQTQFATFYGQGLDYVLVGGECGQCAAMNLPPGAQPVTGFLYVSAQGGANLGNITGTASLNGSLGPITIRGAPSSFTNYQTWHGGRWS